MRDETLIGKFGKGHKMGIGLLAYWLIGLLAYWLIGLLAYWLIGLLAYWLIGLLAYCGLFSRYFIVSQRKFLKIPKNYNQFIYLENYTL